MDADPRTRRRRPRTAAAVLVVVALVVAGAVAWERSRGDDAVAVDPDVVSLVDDLGLTLYDVRLDGAEVTEVRADDAAVVLRYERDGEFRYTVALEAAPSGDLCRARGYGPDGTDPQGGSCTGTGDRVTTAFEEMGAASLRRGDTLVTVDHLVIEADLGIQERALDAAADADRLSIDDLADRLSGD